MAGFIDIHHHIVWGMDDGPSRLEKSIAMLMKAHEDGIRYIIATPHAHAGNSTFNADMFYERLETLNYHCEAHQLDIRIFSGAEVYYSEGVVKWLAEGKIPTLAQSDYVLVEFWEDIPYKVLFDALRGLGNAGFIPVVAHAERYNCLAHQTDHILEIKRLLNVRIQVNCSTILNQKGLRERFFVTWLLKNNAIDYIATDAHDPENRPCCMRACFKELKDRIGANSATEIMGKNQREIFRV